MHILLLLLLASTAFANGPTGDLSAWKGRYDVTKCIHCPDHVINTKANLKNFARFALGYGLIERQYLQSCAQTDTWVGMDFVVAHDNNGGFSSIAHSTGQCDWGYNEVLVATPDTFSYEEKGRFSNKKMSLTIKKLSNDTYQFHQVVHWENPSWGYPKDWEYLAELKKVSATP